MNMAFQINSLEYEEQNVDSQGQIIQEKIRWELQESLRMLNYQENMYEEKMKRIERRDKDLLWTLGVRGGTALLLIGIATFLYFFSEIAFAFIAIAILGLLAGIILIGALRVLFSWMTHRGIVDAPVNLIRNAVYDKKRKQRLTKRGLYTLKQEREAGLAMQSRLLKDKERLRKMLEQPNIDEDTARRLLDELAPQLEAEDTWAVYLYGERYD